MAHPAKRERLVQKYLDPASQLGEVLFGLIMVLGVTLTAGLTVAAGKAGVRQLLQSALGCNLAWGIIDGVMYVMNCLTERSGRTRLLEAVQQAPTPAAGLEIVRNQVAAEFESLSRPEDREALSQAIFQRVAQARPARTRVRKEDFYGALACFWLVFVSCLPAAAPFLIFDQPRLALRVSNCLLIAMLFLIGHKWAQYAHTNRLFTGLAMVAIGLALVGVAVLLGG